MRCSSRWKHWRLTERPERRLPLAKHLEGTDCRRPRMGFLLAGLPAVPFNAWRCCVLTLSRKAGETIVVDGPAAFMVEEIRGNRVRIRMLAPLSTKILRGEIPGADQLMETKEDAGV